MIDKRDSALYVEIDNLKKELADQKTIIAGLTKWKEHCTLVAAGWGGICMTVMTIAGVIHSYWDEIKHYFAGQK